MAFNQLKAQRSLVKKSQVKSSQIDLESTFYHFIENKIKRNVRFGVSGLTGACVSG